MPEMKIDPVNSYYMFRHLHVPQKDCWSLITSMYSFVSSLVCTTLILANILPFLETETSRKYVSNRSRFVW